MSAVLVLWSIILLMGHAARAVSSAQQRRRYGFVDEKLANGWRYFVELTLAACIVLLVLGTAGQADRCSPGRSETWAVCAGTGLERSGP